MADEQSALDVFWRHREYVQCRTYGHAWEEIPVTESHIDGESLWLRCVRCATERHDVFDRRYGHIVHRGYDYPDAYRMSSDEMPSRDEFRLRLFTLANDLADRRSKRRAKAS